MMSSSRTGLGPAAPPTRALGNRIQSLHHLLQGHLFVSQPEPHSPQRRTVRQRGLPLHQRRFGGGEALGRGPPAPPARDWSPAPAEGARGGAARRKRKRCAPRVSPQPPGHPASAPPRGEQGAPQVHPSPRAHPRIPRQSRARSLAQTWALDPGTPRPPESPAGRRTPPGPQPAARPAPPAPGLCALPGAERGAAGPRARSLPAVTSGGPRAGAEAAAAGRALPAPPHAARAAPPRAARWVRGGPVAAARPRTRGVGGKRAPRLRPRDLAMLGTKPPSSFYTRRPAEASHACARAQRHFPGRREPCVRRGPWPGVFPPRGRPYRWSV